MSKNLIFASKSLDKCQRRYCATRRELLAVVTFVTQFRHYLMGKEFVLRTDCSSLRWIMSFRSPTDQMARWLEVLSQYDFRIQHRSGRKHVNVDSLSRIPSEPGACECYEGHLTLGELPCKGCDTCSRKHKQWSDFSQFDDAVPLFAKCNAETAQTSGSSKARVSRVKLQESGFWS